MDIGHRLDCVPSVIWILVTTLTISQVIFYIARFVHNMDIGACLLDCVLSVMWIFVTLQINKAVMENASTNHSLT
jgi:hypothetical protein